MLELHHRNKKAALFVVLRSENAEQRLQHECVWSSTWRLGPTGASNYNNGDLAILTEDGWREKFLEQKLYVHNRQKFP